MNLGQDNRDKRVIEWFYHTFQFGLLPVIALPKQS